MLRCVRLTSRITVWRGSPFDCVSFAKWQFAAPSLLTRKFLRKELRLNQYARNDCVFCYRFLCAKKLSYFIWKVRNMRCGSLTNIIAVCAKKSKKIEAQPIRAKWRRFLLLLSQILRRSSKSILPPKVSKCASCVKSKESAIFQELSQQCPNAHSIVFFRQRKWQGTFGCAVRGFC